MPEAGLPSCLGCGAELAPGRKFCTKCGTAVEFAELEKSKSRSHDGVRAKRASTQALSPRLRWILLVLVLVVAAVSAVIRLSAGPAIEVLVLEGDSEWQDLHLVELGDELTPETRLLRDVKLGRDAIRFEDGGFWRGPISVPYGGGWLLSYKTERAPDEWIVGVVTHEGVEEVSAGPEHPTVYMAESGEVFFHLRHPNTGSCEVMALTGGVIERVGQGLACDLTWAGKGRFLISREGELSVVGEEGILLGVQTDDGRISQWGLSGDGSLLVVVEKRDDGVSDAVIWSVDTGEVVEEFLGVSSATAQLTSEWLSTTTGEHLVIDVQFRDGDPFELYLIDKQGSELVSESDATSSSWSPFRVEFNSAGTHGLVRDRTQESSLFLLDLTDGELEELREVGGARSFQWIDSDRFLVIDDRDTVFRAALGGEIVEIGDLPNFEFIEDVRAVGDGVLIRMSDDDGDWVGYLGNDGESIVDIVEIERDGFFSGIYWWNAQLLTFWKEQAADDRFVLSLFDPSTGTLNEISDDWRLNSDLGNLEGDLLYSEDGATLRFDPESGKRPAVLYEEAVVYFPGGWYVRNW